MSDRPLSRCPRNAQNPTLPRLRPQREIRSDGNRISHLAGTLNRGDGRASPPPTCPQTNVRRVRRLANDEHAGTRARTSSCCVATVANLLPYLHAALSRVAVAGPPIDFSLSTPLRHRSARCFIRRARLSRQRIRISTPINSIRNVGPSRRDRSLVTRKRTPARTQNAVRYGVPADTPVT